jgi:hypothetical protein
MGDCIYSKRRFIKEKASVKSNVCVRKSSKPEVAKGVHVIRPPSRQATASGSPRQEFAKQMLSPEAPPTIYCVGRLRLRACGTEYI